MGCAASTEAKSPPPVVEIGDEVNSVSSPNGSRNKASLGLTVDTTISNSATPRSKKGDDNTDAISESNSEVLLPVASPSWTSPEVGKTPVIDVFVQSHIGANSPLSGQPVKAENQDVVFAESPFNNNEKLALFSVFDGHGTDGLSVAKFCNESVTAILRTFPTYNGTPPELLKKAFIATQREVGSSSRCESKFSGSTASVALIIGNVVHFAHTGDSRGIVVRMGGAVEELGRDHRPDDPAEKERVEMAGGRVVVKVDLDGNPIGPPRVYHQLEPFPGLMLSRSLGDTYAHTLGVTHIPEISSTKLDVACQYLVIASDGVWDVLSSAEVGRIVSVRLSAEAAGNAVVAEALQRWESRMSADNIGLVVVKFR